MTYLGEEYLFISPLDLNIIDLAKFFIKVLSWTKLFVRLDTYLLILYWEDESISVVVSILYKRQKRF